ncbi:hypothetical protein C4565_10935 [Candidatus Parcubacteria bacterium]|jgi:gas vesicle protein|nr:MAG: hypothetical protein C4565_10935 [Candidatus Parcubacteria bacterium]
MKKNNRAKIIEGRLIGAALSIAAGIILVSESTKKFLGDVKKKSAEFHAYIAPQFKKMKQVGEEEYNSFIKTAMETYAQKKRLSEKEKKEIIAHAKKSWKHIKKHQL